MEYIKIQNIQQKVSRIGLGTWAIGGSLWGGSNESESIAAIQQGLEKGINLIDTAPGYGNGLSEKIIGKAIKSFDRDKIVIATKCGLNLEKNAFRDLRRDFILKEIHNSLSRLQVDYIDLYQIHWPDPTTPFKETAEVLKELLKSGKIRAIGLCNFSVEQMNEFKKLAPFSTIQSPHNLFEREIEETILPYAKKEKLTLLGYSSLCRGLLSGKMSKSREFKGDDLRKSMDPKFKEPSFSQYVECAEQLKKWVAKKYNRPLAALAVRWSLDKGVDVALWGVRKPEQLKEMESIFDWKLVKEDFTEIDKIIHEYVKNPAGLEFMEPPIRQEKSPIKA